MNTDSSARASRRDFLKTTGQLAAASALAGVVIPRVHPAEDNTIHLALIGCGGRGNGAVANAMSAGGLVLGDDGGTKRAAGTGAAGPIQLVAMADLRQDRLDQSYAALRQALGDRIAVPPERRFLGFDAYRKAIDCLRPGDVAMLTTHAAFRAPHLEYAVEKGVHVFMEKDFAADPGGIQRILRAGEAAEKKGLKIAAGLMARHSSARQAMIQRIREGAMGEIQLIRAYRMDPGYFMPPFSKKENELLWQLSPGHPYQFLWSSGGIFIELMIHQIDECFWIKDAWPVSAHGVGGRFAGSTDASQNLDSYGIEYTFADGTKAQVTGRYIPKCHNDFSTFVHGTRCAGKFSGDIHAPTSWICKDQRIEAGNIAWRAEKETVNPWQAEWDVLLSAIRNDRPHNESRRAALSNLGAIMGRAAVHTGKMITWEEAMASKFQFCSNVDALTASSPAPVQANAEGRYPAPVPGAWTEI
ncbi:MAG TPA: twin-arginine translocation signal domain-containing protein [Verrucomicrobiota bacterium]|nr:twin-arginine translocation signal domain-containing protein [Verrucomicrobiota bacterium]HNU52408.1 twin-arginine translocation signal domain-containing protein [Verrucomicrobiota bacterium]